MSLQALVFCADEKVARVLRRVLGELEIGMEQCSDADGAIHKLTRKRFEAVLVDCADQGTASRVLLSARAALVNKRAVTVAILSPQTGVGSGVDLGAHFVLHQPLSPERAKTSFRALRALMKRERRRNVRIAVETPLIMQINDGAGQLRALTTDLGEGGMAIRVAHRPKNLGAVTIQFSLPETQDNIECTGQVAWENPRRQLGLRFVDLAPEMNDRLKAWLETRSAEFEQDDPPTPCQLTDLSLGGCYLETVSPFPVRTRILLSLAASAPQLRAEGVVLVMHPEVGMGVEFSQATAPQRESLERFIQALAHGQGTPPQLLVEPEGLEVADPAAVPGNRTGVEDPLLELFRMQSSLTLESFQIELRRQRGHNNQARACKASV
jgi:c-di-GMP-binding flagellar brake protein YcgR